LGVQANVWTETIADNYRLDYMLYPRIAALAETAWTSNDKKSYTSFAQNLKQHFLLYNNERINYFNPFKK
jgi:hexosaminidase